MKITKEDRQEALRRMSRFLEDMHTTEEGPVRRPVYTIVSKTARSGMSRRIRFYYINQNAEPVSLDFTFHEILGWPVNGEGLKVDGVGMDVTVHTLNCVMRALGIEDWQDKYFTRSL